MSKELFQSNAEPNQHGVLSNVDDSLVERMWHELDGQVSREQIGRIVAEIAVRYQDAPVQVFVPILIHRQAFDKVKKQLNDRSYRAAGRTPVNEE